MKRFQNPTINPKYKNYCTDFFQKFGTPIFTNSVTTAILATLQYLKSQNQNLRVGVQGYGHPSSDNCCNVLNLKKVYIRNSSANPLNMSYTDLKEHINEVNVVIYSETDGYISNNILKVQKLCKTHNVFLIEDSAASLGAEINNKPLGTFGDVSMFSFSGTKICYLGGGGVLNVKSPEIAKQIQRFIHIEDYQNFENTCLTSYLPEAAFQTLQSELQDLNNKIQKRIQIYNQYSNSILKTSGTFSNAASSLNNSPKLRKTLNQMKIEYRDSIYPDFLNQGIREKHIDLPYFIEMTENDVNLVKNILKMSK